MRHNIKLQVDEVGSLSIYLSIDEHSTKDPDVETGIVQQILIKGLFVIPLC
jgi:hypothetical protein